MFPFCTSFIKRPKPMVKSKHVSITLEITEAMNLLSYRTLFKYSAERKTCGCSYACKLEYGNYIDYKAS